MLFPLLLSTLCQVAFSAAPPGKVVPDFQCDDLHAAAELLPNTTFIPFELAVANITLSNWEDQWFASVKYGHKPWGFGHNSYGKLEEPKIDIVHTWVNGSDVGWQNMKHKYENISRPYDKAGYLDWIKTHTVNRYREWDELRYSFRSVDHYATFGNFLNNRILVVSSVEEGKDRKGKIKYRKQVPEWLREDGVDEDEKVTVVGHEQFFGEEGKGCLPTFSSQAIEGQVWRTDSDTDHFLLMNDDVFLATHHVSSDIYSPLFGPIIQLYDEPTYNTVDFPSSKNLYGDAPFLKYTSWLLNQRFGPRPRKIPFHSTHSLSRSLMKEMAEAFPKASTSSAIQRFRGLDANQLHNIFAATQYRIERFREALLWSWIMLRSDRDGDGELNWFERLLMLSEIEQGLEKERSGFKREPQTKQEVDDHLEDAGLPWMIRAGEIAWASIDGPVSISERTCKRFNVTKCLGTEFGKPDRYPDSKTSSKTLFETLSKDARCGDCLIKVLLNKVSRGLSPLFPSAERQSWQRVLVVKALKKYQYILNVPKVVYVSVKNAEQLDDLSAHWFQNYRDAEALCLNDDVRTENEMEIEQIRTSFHNFLLHHFPDPGLYEK